jgi:hypothetical protein
MARNQGKSGSEILGINDDVLAWNFNRACSFRLSVYDNQCRESQAKLIAYEVSKLFGDGSGGSNGGDAPEAW